MESREGGDFSERKKEDSKKGSKKGQKVSVRLRTVVAQLILVRHHIIACALLLLVCFYYDPSSYWNGTWFGKWAILLAIIGVLFSQWVGRKVHWSVAPVLLSTTLGALWVFAWRDNRFVGYALVDKISISKSATYALVATLMFVFGFLAAKVRTIRVLGFALGVVCFVGSVVTLFSALDAQRFRGGFFGNPSMNGCLLAITLPFAFDFFKRWYLKALVLVPILAAIILVRASVPIVTLGVVSLAWLYIKGFRKACAIGLLVCLCVGYAIEGASFASTNGRWEIWEMGLKYWWANANPWFGVGTGVTTVYLPYLQNTLGVQRGNWFMWFHNDWLQILFEQGIVGFSAVLVMFLCALKRAIHNHLIGPALLGYGVCALGNYPLHLPVHAFVGAYLVAAAFMPNSSGSSQANGIWKWKCFGPSPKL